MPALPDTARDLFAGTIGGWAQVVTGHPFDTLKVRMQVNPTKYSGALDCLRQTVKAEGPQSVYKGVASPLMGIGICNAVVFAANGHFRRMLHPNPSQSHDQPLSLPRMFVAGAMAGGVMSLFNCPIELLKVKLQVQQSATNPAAAAVSSPYTGVINCGVRTFREHGARGLYRGYFATFVRDVPSFSAYFGTYEGLKRAFLAYRNRGSDTPVATTNTSIELVTAGGFAGIAAWLVCYPQDVVKSRMQKDRFYSSTKECWKALVAEANASGLGLRAYFRGFSPALIRAFPANAATFVAYEWAMKITA
ncbi:mitochondrial substrate carrier family protein [Ramicandelaber brevisporus]|nr:mitochondrial substrate carrier family protein [Ramicandelaber brevisporus]